MRRLTTRGGILSSIQHRDWLLLLNARNLPHTIVMLDGVEHIFVPALVENIARHEMAAFAKENLPESRPTFSWPHHRFWQLAPIYLLPLVLLHLLLPQALTDSALLDGSRLRFHGEWYRLVTALALHVNWAHLAGNLLFGSLFLCLLARICGVGHAWLLTLASGIGGNFLSAFLHIAAYKSVGFSTAVFGSIGILAGLHIAGSFRKWLKPLAAAIAMLAMLGTAGDNTDYAAHIMGLLVGLFCGLGEGRAIVHQKPLLPQWLAALLALLIPVAAWHYVV